MSNGDLIELAHRYFISDSGLSSENLIRKIQVAEGNIDCFKTGKNECDQTACRWRKDCLGKSAE
jgi:hypothetical protein